MKKVFEKLQGAISGKSDLWGTVDFHTRHVGFCIGKKAEEWPPKINELEDKPLLEELHALIKEKSLPIKLTLLENPQLEENDIIIFPDMLKYKIKSKEDIQTIFQKHFVENLNESGISNEKLTGVHVMVCIHGNRDQKCGNYGPPIIARFNTELAKRNIHNVFIYGSSHVGGHKFAGNVLIYPGGDWYGRITENDVPLILDEHIIKGRRILEKWRGIVGMEEEVQKKSASNNFEGCGMPGCCMMNPEKTNTSTTSSNTTTTTNSSS